MPAAPPSELGPTLPELLASWPRAVRRALLAVAAVVAVAALTLAVRPGSRTDRVVVEGEVPFNVVQPAGFRRLPAPRDGLILAGPGQRLVVRPLRLPAYRGDVSAALMVRAGVEEDALRRGVPGFVLRGEGRTRVNEQPGYQLQYQYAGAGGRTAYGRVVLLVPPEDDEPVPRAGAVLALTSGRSPAVATVFALGDNGALKTSLRSFRFGTDAP